MLLLAAANGVAKMVGYKKWGKHQKERTLLGKIWDKVFKNGPNLWKTAFKKFEVIWSAEAKQKQLHKSLGQINRKEINSKVKGERRV